MSNPLLDVLKTQHSSHRTPVWLMRQAGRYLPEYRQLRKSFGGFLEMALDADAACEITLQPLKRFDLDAAIIFSDILMVPYGLGQSLEFIEGQGPHLGDLNLQNLTLDNLLEKVSPTLKALELVAQKLPQDKTLIGFAGAPWTIMAYMIQGKSSRDFEDALNYVYAHEDQFLKLQELIVQATVMYLVAQVKAGAQVVQLFDSWSGFVSQNLWQNLVLDPTQRIVAAFKKECPNTPFIWFPKGIGSRLSNFPQGIDGISLDQYTDLSIFAQHAPKGLVWQGGLDPAALRAGGSVLVKSLDSLFNSVQGQPYIFNLGHGMTPDIPVEHVEELIQWIRQREERECHKKPLSSSI